MYNTILGAKSLEADGRTFYYSDYNLSGKKVYSDHRWPCCSGTMTQVAADYRINAYFREARGVWVNLYIPSTVKWAQGGAQISLTQKSDYPYDSHVQFEIKASKPMELAVNLRIPAWAEKASFAVNGKRQAAVAGCFAQIAREWKDGDRIDLDLPMAARLEPVDPKHPETVAVLVGPLVLFALMNPPKVTRAQLLAVKKMTSGVWHVELGGTVPIMKMLAWTAIEEQPYTTYLRVT